MAWKRLSGAWETSQSYGAGALILAGAYSNKYKTFATAGAADGDTFDLRIEHSVASRAEWEECVGSWGTGGVITRGTLKSSSTGSRIDFSPGGLLIFSPLFADRVPSKDANDRVLATTFLGLKSVAPQALAFSGAPATTVNVDLALGDRFKLVNTANIAVINFLNLPAEAQRFIVDFIGDGNVRTQVWTAGNKTVYWPGDTAPGFTAGAGKRDRVVFDWDGTFLLGAISGQGYAV